MLVLLLLHRKNCKWILFPRGWLLFRGIPAANDLSATLEPGHSTHDCFQDHTIICNYNDSDCG